MAVNKMTDHLVAAQDDLARTNRRLTAINQVMLAAERQAEIHDVLFAILQSTIEVMNLQTGWVYLRDPERDTFHLGQLVPGSGRAGDSAAAPGERQSLPLPARVG